MTRLPGILSIAALSGLAMLATSPVAAANLSKTYSYFSIGGSTLDEIQVELTKRGPHVKSTGLRHPGATQMEFTSRIGYVQKGGYCQIVAATVTVKAKLILPRWRRTKQAESDVRFIWATLNSDIKRHEESHVVIAKRYAWMIEQELRATGRQNDCAIAAEKAKLISTTMLAKHDAAQQLFDRVEGIGFEKRLLSLLKYRWEQALAGRFKY